MMISNDNKTATMVNKNTVFVVILAIRNVTRAWSVSNAAKVKKRRNYESISADYAFVTFA